MAEPDAFYPSDRNWPRQPATNVLLAYFWKAAPMFIEQTV